MNNINTEFLDNLIKQLSSMYPDQKKEALYEVCKTFLRMNVNSSAEYESAIKFVTERLEL